MDLPTPSELGILIGPQLIGILLDWMLFGVLTVQTYLYFITFPSDFMYIKLLVYFAYAIELAQTIMVTSDAFAWFVYGWGNLASIPELNVNWFDVPIITGMVSMVVQCFFAWRIWKLGQSRLSGLLAGSIVFLSLYQGSSAFGAGIKVKLLGSFAKVHEINNVDILSWYIGSAVADVAIAASMTYLLLKSSKSSPAVAQTKSIIRRLVQLTVETGSITASAAIVTLILFQLSRTGNGNAYLALSMFLSKLYTNSLLAVFNNRILLRQAGASGISGTGSRSGGDGAGIGGDALASMTGGAGNNPRSSLSGRVRARSREGDSGRKNRTQKDNRGFSWLGPSDSRDHKLDQDIELETGLGLHLGRRGGHVQDSVVSSVADGRANASVIPVHVEISRSVIVMDERDHEVTI